MTKKEQYQQLREMFFQQVEEHYPGTTIDSDGGGRWQMDINGAAYELGSLNYGGEVLSYNNDGDEEVKRIEEELNTLLETVFNMFPEL